MDPPLPDFDIFMLAVVYCLLFLGGVFLYWRENRSS